MYFCTAATNQLGHFDTYIDNAIYTLFLLIDCLKNHMVKNKHAFLQKLAPQP